jgi:hypothetical protein
VTLGQSKAGLTLQAFRFTYQRKRYSVVLAQLLPKAPDVVSGSRMIKLESSPAAAGNWSPSSSPTQVGARSGRCRRERIASARASTGRTSLRQRRRSR